MYNKTERMDIRAGGPQLTHDYAYDSIYRLVRTVVTDPATAVLRDTEYDLDGVGNRDQVIAAPDPLMETGPYFLDPTLPEPADFQMNQYTTTPSEQRTYDKNGNLVSLIDPGAPPPMATIQYDYRNQMVSDVDPSASGGAVTAQYAYDALGRRIARTVNFQTTRYFYDGWQVVEEQDGLGITQATYVYGLYIDEVLTMQRSGADFYYHTDDLYNVMAVTDAAGTVVEGYEYGDYGQPVDPTTLDPIEGDPSSIGNPYLFTGRRYDLETGWYYYRTRYLDPLGGRFTTRDSIGIWGDIRNLGNGYNYVGNNPFTWRDPFGLLTEEDCRTRWKNDRKDKRADYDQTLNDCTWKAIGVGGGGAAILTVIRVGFKVGTRWIPWVGWGLAAADLALLAQCRRAAGDKYDAQLAKVDQELKECLDECAKERQKERQKKFDEIMEKLRKHRKSKE